MKCGLQRTNKSIAYLSYFINRYLGVVKAEELDEARRKAMAKAQELQEQLDAANARILSLDKARHRTQQELEDAQVDAERVKLLYN